MTRFAYLHGLGSGPRANKAVALGAIAAARSLPFFVPDLNVPSFEELSIAAMLDRVSELDGEEARGERWCLIASSLGGYVGALWAERHAARVERLVLLCPAFAFGPRWRTLIPAEDLARWERGEPRPIADATGALRPVHAGLYREALALPPLPEVPCPTVIVHGRADTVVPIALSREYAASRPHVRLFEVDDDHSLARSVEVIAAHAWPDGARSRPGW